MHLHLLTNIFDSVQYLLYRAQPILRGLRLRVSFFRGLRLQTAFLHIVHGLGQPVDLAGDNGHSFFESAESLLRLLHLFPSVLGCWRYGGAGGLDSLYRLSGLTSGFVLYFSGPFISGYFNICDILLQLAVFPADRQRPPPGFFRLSQRLLYLPLQLLFLVLRLFQSLLQPSRLGFCRRLPAAGFLLGTLSLVQLLFQLTALLVADVF